MGKRIKAKSSRQNTKSTVRTSLKFKSKSTNKQARNKKFDSKKTKKLFSHKKPQISTARKVISSSSLDSDKPELSDTTKLHRRTIKRPLHLKKSANSTSTQKLPKMQNLTRKQRKQIRQQNKPNFELAKSSKNSWEKLRQKNLDKAKRELLVGELLRNLTDKLDSFVLRHDTSRVIQTMVKYGNDEQRALILEQVKKQFIPICKTRYSKFLIPRFLKCSNSTQRAEIIQLMGGHVRELLRHSEGGKLIESAYNDHANKEQRREIMLEIFSPEFIHIKPRLYSLSEVVEGDEVKRGKISKSLKEYLVSMETKPVWGYSVVHTALVEFFSIALDQDRTDLIQVLSKKCVEMVHTRDGTLSMMHFIWHGTAKDRKAILNSLKPFLKKICTEEHGYLSLLSIFDSVDDTVLVAKIFQNLNQDAFTEILTNQHGRKIYFYIVSPRNPKYFHPDIMKVLTKGDGNATSKKSRAIRYEELQNKILPNFASVLVKNVEPWILSKSSSILYLAALDSPNVNLDLLKSSLVSVLKNSPELVEHDSVHTILITAFKRDRIVSPDETTFFSLVLEQIGLSEMAKWAGTNRGAFVLDSAMSLADSDTRVSMCDEVFGGDFVPPNTKGVSLLRATIQS